MNSSDIIQKLSRSSQHRLLTLLCNISPQNKKDIAIHEDLMKPLDLIVGARKLRLEDLFINYYNL